MAYAAARGATFVYHGVTHQYGFGRNPFTGMTGDDFEFWDRKANRPVAADSPRFVVERIEDGLEILNRSGARPVAWMTPHYQASPLDYALFGRLFAWNLGRVIYFPSRPPSGGPLPPELEIARSQSAGNGQRLRHLASVRALAPEQAPSGQFYPYEIFGDVYGQRLIPENVGNLQPFMNEQVLKSISVDDMVRILRRNAVLRDAWASFFIHPSMLEDSARGGAAAEAGGTAEIERLVREALASGYEFVDLAAWVRETPREMRPEPIEVTP
ncbi:MAG: DUF2334 domain-containing protein [Proteobacteria bacterium]|nr:DUF2334 domain-containing protein [Pseudomonadota bacterium]